MSRPRMRGCVRRGPGSASRTCLARYTTASVIDVEGSDLTVILGSYNWTDSGAYDNDENTLIIHDRDLARAYYAGWERLLGDGGVGQDMQLLRRIPAGGGA